MRFLVGLFYAVTICSLLTSGCVEKEVGSENSRVVENQTKWLSEASVYIYMTAEIQAEDGSIRQLIEFDEDSAQKDGMSQNAVLLVRQMVEQANKLRTNDEVRHERLSINSELVSFFEAYTYHQDKYDYELVDGDNFAVVRQSLDCGGSFRNPSSCLPHSHTSRRWSSQEDVVSYLESRGYHRTARYIGTDDYTKALYTPCGKGVYRYQASVVGGSGKWGYKWQKDLNPEVYSQPLWGDWPHWWWDIYVYWWHAFYCD